MNLSRREFLQLLAIGAAQGLPLAGGAYAATHGTRLYDLGKAQGNVTLMHMTDCHAQLLPSHFREPDINIGIANARGRPPHLVGKAVLQQFGIKPGTREAHAYTHLDFVNAARTYGKVGGFAHLATLVKQVRAQRPGALLLDGGDTWQGSYTALKTSDQDMVDVMNALGVEAMTGHWEFTYGTERVEELIGKLNFPFLAGNIIDTEWQEKVFPSTQFFERGGIRIAVIGQAFPYTPVANPRHMIPDWSFGIRENLVRENVDAARKAGAQLVVMLSHNGFDVDRKLASRVDGIDVILTGHTHDALPEAVRVGDTLLVASGSHGKFLARLDLDVKDGRVADYEFKLIPVFSDVITPDPEMAALIKKIRAPHEQELNTVLGTTGSTLYRRGNFNGTFDDLICQALLQERDAEIALSPGFRWGSSLLPGQDITTEDVFNQTAITYPKAYRTEMTGQLIKDILEDVGDNLFNTDPYYQQGGDMVRVGGAAYTIDINQTIGNRFSDLTLLKDGSPIDPARTYVVAGWASVNEATEGPPVYDLVSKYIRSEKVVTVPENTNIKIKGA